MESINIERAQREEARWRILAGLYIGRPLPLTETILYRLLHDVTLPITPKALRTELDYLRERKLVALEDEDTRVWSAKLTRHGTDFVEYTIPAEPGIARPPEWRD